MVYYTRLYISHSHMWYQPVTCPGTYGIPPYPFWVRRCHHQNMSSHVHRWYWPVTCTRKYSIPPYPFWVRRCNHRNMSSHGHRGYWPVTCPGTYGISPYPFWVRRWHHRNMSSATNLQFRFDSSDSSCVNSRPLFLLTPRQYISRIPGYYLCRIDFNRWDYHANISHCGGINYGASVCARLSHVYL